MKKNILGFIGLVLLLSFFIGGWKYLSDWSSAELVGYNLGGLFQLVGGGWLFYYGLKKNKKDTPVN